MRCLYLFLLILFIEILENVMSAVSIRLAEQRLTDYRAGRSQAVPLEEVMKRYGLEG